MRKVILTLAILFSALSAYALDFSVSGGLASRFDISFDAYDSDFQNTALRGEMELLLKMQFLFDERDGFGLSFTARLDPGYSFFEQGTAKEFTDGVNRTLAQLGLLYNHFLMPKLLLSLDAGIMYGQNRQWSCGNLDYKWLSIGAYVETGIGYSITGKIRVDASLLLGYAPVHWAEHSTGGSEPLIHSLDGSTLVITPSLIASVVLF